MDTTRSAPKAISIGRTTIAAAAAGLAGLGITLAVAASMLISAPASGGSSGLLGGYEDYGSRHRADFAAPDVRSSGQLDDYGIRCLAVDWCSEPAGVPQPAGWPATH